MDNIDLEFTHPPPSDAVIHSNAPSSASPDLLQSLDPLADHSIPPPVASAAPSTTNSSSVLSFDPISPPSANNQTLPLPIPPSNPSTAPPAASVTSLPSSSSSSSLPSYGADRYGWQYKRGYTSGVFEKRFFLLTVDHLVYYKLKPSSPPSVLSSPTPSLSDLSQCFKISLEGSSVDIAPETKYGRAFTYELNSPINGRIYALSCDAAADMAEWMNAIRKTMLKIRREKSKAAAAKRKENYATPAIGQQHPLASSSSMPAIGGGVAGGAGAANIEGSGSLLLSNPVAGGTHFFMASSQQSSNAAGIQGYRPSTSVTSTSSNNTDSSGSYTAIPSLTSTLPLSSSTKADVYRHWIEDSLEQKKRREANEASRKGSYRPPGAGVEMDSEDPRVINAQLLMESKHKKAPLCACCGDRCMIM